MRRRRSIIVALCAVLAACAPLLSYDGFDAPVGSAEGGLDASDARVENSSVAETGGDDAPSPGDAGSCADADPTVPDGYYCGDALDPVHGDASVNFECKGDVAVRAIYTCAFGCIQMPPKRSDWCETCDGHTNGTYCISDLTTDNYPADPVLVTCTSGRTTKTQACTTCTSNGSNSSCP
jgi:hypothetical protein